MGDPTGGDKAAEGQSSTKEAKQALRLTLPWAVRGLFGVAGLAVYVELVGGAVMWARYRSAGIPEIQTVEALSPEYLLVVGITALFIPLLAGVAAASLQYVLSPSNPEGTIPSRFGMVLLLLVLFAIYMSLRVDGLSSGARLVLIAAAAAGAVGSWLVARRSRGFVSLALIFFVFGAVYGAAFKVVREIDITPRFDLGVVFRGDEHPPVAGLFLGETADKVVLARYGDRDAGEWLTVVIPQEQVTSLAIGPRSQAPTLRSQRKANALKTDRKKLPLENNAGAKEKETEKAGQASKNERGRASERRGAER